MALKNDLIVKNEREKRNCLVKLIKNMNLMLEYNQNGLMNLLIYILQLFILMLQIIKASSYSSLSTIRDPTTKEFQDPWLRFCEQIYLIDLSYMIGKNNMYNQMHLVLSLQFLILRLRALYLRIQTSIINEHIYQKMNILETNIAFLSQLRLTSREWLQLSRDAIYHQCKDIKSFSGQSRLAVLKFNEKLRELTKIDKLYGNNMIDFGGCFKSINPMEDYEKKTQLIDKSNELHNLEEKGVSWFKYIFSIDLPNRIDYVAKPYHRLDLKGLDTVLLLYIIANIGMFLMVIISSFSAINVAIFYDDSSATYNTALMKFFEIKYAIGIFNMFLIIIVYAVNTYENGLLALCSIITLSRSKKIIRLLKLERSFCRSQFINFQKLSDNFRRSLRKFKNCKYNLATRLKQFNLYLQINSEQNFHHNKFKLSILNHQFNQYNWSLNNQLIMPEESLNYLNKNRSNEFYYMSLIYKNWLREERILELNENLDYITDLIVSLQNEFDDLKSILTTPLNINIIFGTIGSSITVAMILDSNDLITFVLSLAIGSASIIPLIFALYAGATNEGAVSNMIYLFHLLSTSAFDETFPTT